MDSRILRSAACKWPRIVNSDIYSCPCQPRPNQGVSFQYRFRPCMVFVQHLIIVLGNGKMTGSDTFWLLWGYGLLLGSMFEASGQIYRSLVITIASWHRTILSSHTAPISLRILAYILKCIDGFIWLIHCIVTSCFLRLLFDLVWFGVSMYILVRDRRKGQKLIGNGTENVWGFGQVFPCFVLLLPLLTSIEAFYGMPFQRADLNDNRTP